MASKKYFTADKRQDGVVSNLNQVIDVIQEDISGSATRRKYETFVTGGIGPGVTSSLYQTVYDQDFTLQTANAVMDMTVGLFCDELNTTPRQNLVTITANTGFNSSGNGQLLFDTTHTMMMREKVNIYRQYAKLLLGDADLPFCIAADNNPAKNTIDRSNATSWATSTTIMDACLFVNVKRLFARDRIRPETFAMRLYENAPRWYKSSASGLVDQDGDGVNDWVWDYDPATGADNSSTMSTYGSQSNAQANLFGGGVSSSEDGVKIIADIGASGAMYGDAQQGTWAYLKHASDITQVVGILFYDHGIAVLNLGGSSVVNSSWGKGTNTPSTYSTTFASDSDGGEGQESTSFTIKPVFSPRDFVNGVVSGMMDSHHANGAALASDWGNQGAATAGQVYVGYADGGYEGTATNTSQGGLNGPQINPYARFYPDLLVSASIDDIVDHIGYTRFSSGSLTACAFQNITKINSSIFFCRATAAQFNGSTNPTWSDPANNGTWLLNSSSENSPFTYITTVLLYDDEDDIVAVAKLNRPIEKNNQSELTIRVRLDF